MVVIDGFNNCQLSIVNCQLNFLVVITRRSHPFPFRTRQLSFSVPMILGRKRPGKVGRRQIYIKTLWFIPQGLVVVIINEVYRLFF